MALRSPEVLADAMRRGDALLALVRPEAVAPEEAWAGFAYVSPWEAGRFVSTSALIVRPEWRGRGVARGLKAEALGLARRRYPRARPFGLSTSEAVARVNRELGFREVPYSELPRDPAFWKGCESCPLHAVLLAREGASCHCRAFLFPEGLALGPPAEARRDSRDSEPR
jgi:GNAT superfamily N-acetyltransferase